MEIMSQLKTMSCAWIIGLSACASVNTPPQDASQAIPVASSGFTDEGIAALETTMSQYVADQRLYGIATRLVKNGEIVSDVRTGLRELEARAPIEEDTIYRIYSMTKPITGVAMMMLWEDGAFTLDDPVTNYIPEFEGLRVISGVSEDGSPILVDASRAPTMREIMSHTAGFAYGLAGTDVANTAFREQKILESPDLQTFIERVADVPLIFEPGTAWAYSASVDVQGYLIEKLSGQNFGEYLETRIFAPLGMVDTGFFVPEADYSRFSEVYGFDPESGHMVPVPYPQVQFRQSTIAMESGGGGLVSTMNDYTQFCQMLLNGGELDGTRLLKAETVTLMTTNLLPPEIALSSDGSASGEAYPGIGFGLNVGVIFDPVAADTPQAPGSYFWGGAAGTWFWIDPANDLFFIGMVQIFSRGNTGEPLELRETSSVLVYDALEN